VFITRQSSSTFDSLLIYQFKYKKYAIFNMYLTEFLLDNDGTEDVTSGTAYCFNDAEHLSARGGLIDGIAVYNWCLE